jgi:hypothetical protein
MEVNIWLVPLPVRTVDTVGYFSLLDWLVCGKKRVGMHEKVGYAISELLGINIVTECRKV